MKSVFFQLSVLSILFLISACADLQQAKVYYSGAKYGEAVKELKPLVRRDFPEACYLLGRMIVEGKVKGYESSEGVKFLEKAYKLGYWKAARELGFYFLSLGKPQIALRWFSRAASHGDSRSRMAAIKLELSTGQLYGEKLKELEKKAVNEPGIFEAIGDYYAFLGKIGKAIEFYRDGYNRGVVEAGLKLAKLYIKIKKTTEALRLLENIYYKHRVKQAALLIGRIYEKKGRDIHLSYCPVLKFKDMKSFFRAKLVLKNSREIYYSRALEWYRRAFPLEEARYRYMRIRWVMNNKPCGNYFEILKFVRKGVKVALSDIKRLYYSGRCRLPYGSEVSPERNALRLGNELLSTSTYTSSSSATRYFEEGVQLLSYDRRRAISYLEKACSYGSVSAEIELALIMEDKNPNLAAAVLYYYASRIKVPRAMLALSRLYFKFGKKKEALKWLEKAARDFRYTPARRYLAIYLLNHGKEKEAIEYLEGLEKQKYCFASILLGAAYEGDYGELPVDLEKAFYHYRIALVNECPEAYFRLARLYLFKNRLRKALLLARRYAVLRENQIKAFVLLFRIEEALGRMRAAAKYMEIAISKGYLPTPGELEELFAYMDKDFLLRGKVRWITYEVLAKKMYRYDFNTSFCMIYESAMRSVPQSAMVLFKIGLMADTSQKGYFVEAVSQDPLKCDIYLKDHSDQIKKMIIMLRRELLEEHG